VFFIIKPFAWGGFIKIAYEELSSGKEVDGRYAGEFGEEFWREAEP
jgi:hypothetical protein